MIRSRVKVWELTLKLHRFSCMIFNFAVLLCLIKEERDAMVNIVESAYEEEESKLQQDQQIIGGELARRQNYASFARWDLKNACQGNVSNLRYSKKSNDIMVKLCILHI